MNTEKGDLLKYVKRGVIVQQVNAQGVMGSGIAKSIREQWPAVWTAYRDAVPSTAGNGQRHLGKLIMVRVEPELWVANIVGQQYYGKDRTVRYTSYDALDEGFQKLELWLLETDFLCEDIHHPLIGCGLGGGKWPVVEAIISTNLGDDTTLWVL